MDLVNFLISWMSKVSAYLVARIGVNLLDVVVGLVVLFYAHEGYALGFVLASLDLISFVLSFIAALKLYGLVAQGMMSVFSIPVGFANAVGFFMVAFVSEVILSLLFRYLLGLLPRIKKENAFTRFFQKIDHFLGLIPGAVSAFIVLAFLLSVIVSLPSSPFVKHLVTGSRMGSVLVSNTSTFESKLNDIFGGALHETLNFMTVKPESNELVNLHFRVNEGKPLPEIEKEMLKLVNIEREKAGVAPVVFDNDLRDVARKHSRDMLARGYFSHYTPEGKSPFDRMTESNISFIYAGENLAFAPSVELAMQGLMNSPGHRANILNPNFGRLGIGAIDGGIYGVMFSQEFTN